MIKKYRLDSNCYYRIYDFKNRSGENLDDELFKDDLKEYTDVWRKINSIYREKTTIENKKSSICYLYSHEASMLLKKFNDVTREYLEKQFDAIINSFDVKKNNFSYTKNRLHSWLRRVKKQIILKRLCEFEFARLNGEEKLILEYNEYDYGGKKKPVFSLKNKMFSFPLAVVNQQLKMKYSVCPADRNTVMNQLDLILRMEKVNLGILRLDIKSFYENIPFDKVINKLEKDALIDKSVLGVIKEVRNAIAENAVYTSNNQDGKIGLPRGLSISAYLSEYYMMDFDNSVRHLDNVVYYSRYVDDIIIVVCEVKDQENTNRLNIVEEETSKLLSNDNLEAYFNVKDKYNKSKKNISFDYLGYKITRDDKTVTYSMSHSKMDKYKDRINSIFNAYLKVLRESDKKKYNKRLQEKRKKALKVLILRLRLLTGRVLVPIIGGHTFIGISESYPLLPSNDNAIVELDNYLDDKIKKTGKLSTIFKEEKLFSKAFDPEHYYRIKPKRMGEVNRWVRDKG